MNPETQTITVHPKKGELPFEYVNLREMESWSISGHTFVWHNTKTSGDTSVWYLNLPPPAEGLDPVHVKFQGVAYVTGSFSFRPDDDDHPIFANSGTSEETFREMVEWTGETTA